MRVDTSGGTNQFIAPFITILDGTWHHVVYTLNSGAYSVYKDGVRVNSSTYIHGTGFSNSSNLTTNVNGVMPVALDDVRIYNRALSAQEIQQLYAQGSANVAHSSPVTLSSGLVGYWTFDGPSINWRTGAVADSSGQGNTGQMIAMSTSSSPTPGKIGQGLRFNGSSSYVNVTDASNNFSFTNTTFTVTAWIKTTADGYIVAKEANTSGWGLIITGGHAEIYLKNANAAIPVSRASATPLGEADGKWHFVVGVATTNTSAPFGNTASIYVDGVAQQWNAQTRRMGLHASRIIASYYRKTLNRQLLSRRHRRRTHI